MERATGLASPIRHRRPRLPRSSVRSPRCASDASRSTAGRYSATWPLAREPAGGHTRTAARARAAASVATPTATRTSSRLWCAPHTSPPPLTATAPRHLLPFHLLPPLSPGARPATHHRAALRQQRSTLRRLPESRAAAGARSLALPLAGPEGGSCASFLRRLEARLAAPGRCGGRLIGCPATASAARASLPQSR